MKTYSGFEYLCIDICNQHGGDKLLFEDRIQWVKDNMDDLESFADTAETAPMYKKAVMAMRKAQQGLPTGHLVGLDACCSGIQVMSALTGCVAGATATGMVNPNVRADAYATCTETMDGILGGGFSISRKDAKRALMTSFYGSKEVPKKLFGEDTPELDAFYKAAEIIAPGPWELLQILLAAWKPMALEHSWKLPDGYDSVVKVMTIIKDTPRNRIEVDELDSTFTYVWAENLGTEKGLSLVANVTHSVDAYILRAMHRRCNYDRQAMEYAASIIEAELIDRMLGAQAQEAVSTKVDYYVQQYARSSLADAVILPYLDDTNVVQLSDKHLKAMSKMVNEMLGYQPFELVTVHDEFRAHVNNLNHVRQNYINILADLADSNLLTDLLRQITGKQDTYQKLSSNLSTLIRGSEYALS